MNAGSRGPHVVLMKAFLCGTRCVTNNLSFGQQYDDETARYVNAFQAYSGLAHDGHFGPQTRKHIKNRHNFDFEAACEAVPGTTIFVQPDGTEISWSPDQDAFARHCYAASKRNPND